jgi:hypothetical protein
MEEEFTLVTNPETLHRKLNTEQHKLGVKSGAPEGEATLPPCATNGGRVASPSGAPDLTPSLC